MSDDSSRPTKRARQACEGCRRKKTRCPGEQPACSLCVRLGQLCSYGNGIKAPDSDQSVSERLRSLESKMDMMLTGHLYQSPHHASEGAATAAPPRAWSVHSSQDAPSQSPSTFPPKHVTDNLIILYDERCNYQPLPLFNSGFAESYEARDQELLNIIFAIASRFSSRYETAFGLESSAEYAKKASKSVTQKLISGGISLSTIQTMCLLSFWEFTDGQKERSWLHLDIALWLAQHSRLIEEPEWDIPSFELEERRRCAWSLYILGRMSGMRSTLPIFTCRFPGTTSSPVNSPGSRTTDEEIIISNNIKLYDIWEKVQHFAAQSDAEAGKSLWTGDSEYGSIVSALMEYESQFPDEHRFSEQTSGTFKGNPAYWAPWFSIQFMYHAILCLLNHPFLLSVRLDPIREKSPRTFRQTTADLAKLHSYWAFRFTSVAKEFGYAVADPLIAYAVTIAATIFDHYRLSSETQARRDARDKFLKCMAFVREVGNIWPIAAHMAQLLQNLERSTTSQLQTDTDHSIERADILWTLLRYSAVSASCSPPEQSLFSDTLLPQHARQSNNLEGLPPYQPPMATSTTSASRPLSRSRETRIQEIQAQMTPDSHADPHTTLSSDMRQFEQSLQTTLLDDVLGASFEWWDQGNL